METRDFEMLCQHYTVPANVCQRTLDMIIATQLNDKTSVPLPKAVVIGGQPGAGKSGLQRLCQQEMAGNLVLIDADHLRDYHPQATEILRNYEKEYSPLTNQFAYALYEGLTSYCRQHCLNYAMESTFKSSDYVNGAVRELKDAGYHVEIKLMAVDPQLSLLGTRLRYEIAKQTWGYGRFVGEEFHNYCCQNIRHSIRGVQQQGIYDQLNIYARSALVDVSKMDGGTVAVAQNPNDAYSAYSSEVSRQWPEELLENVKEKCGVVVDLMKGRGAATEEIESFKRSMSAVTEQRRVHRAFRA